MKKRITIYILGVILSFIMNMAYVNKYVKSKNDQYTYGDIAFCFSLSLFSWVNVASLSIWYLAQLDFWNKPISGSAKV